MTAPLFHLIARQGMGVAPEKWRVGRTKACAWTSSDDSRQSFDERANTLRETLGRE